LLDLRSESVVNGEQPGAALITGKNSYHGIHQALNPGTFPSTHTQVSYRKDKSSTQQEPMQAVLMLRANWSQAKRQSQNPAARTSPALRGVCGHSDKHAPRKFLEAQCAFKIWMIHEVLQFALRIAFRCVLHRCGSLDIRC
jgi:hypothetical protein